jgi:hypothetical protein
MYYKLYIEEKKIAWPIALLFIVIIFFGIILLFNNNKSKSNKTQTEKLKQMEIVNVSANSVSIYWRTSGKSIGHITYGNKISDIGNIIYDDRDKPGTTQARVNHLVTLRDLTSNTKYYYYLNINGDNYKNVDNNPFSFTTSNVSKQTTNLKPAYGIIVDTKNKPVVDSAVLLKIKNISPLFAFTKSDGSFLISLNYLLDKSNYLPIRATNNEDTIIEINDEDKNELKIETNVNLLSNLGEKLVMQPGTMTKKINEKISLEQQYLKKEDNQKTMAAFDFIYPKIDASIPDAKPLIKGVAEPYSQIDGIIIPEKRKFIAMADKDGVWKYTPIFDLSAGEHTISVTTKDELVLERSFFIQKSGEAVLGEATPSASITPVLPTSPPVASTSPTIEVPTVAPTAIPTTSAESTITPLPTSGFDMVSTSLSIGVALLMLGAGLVLMF